MMGLRQTPASCRPVAVKEKLSRTKAGQFFLNMMRDHRGLVPENKYTRQDYLQGNIIMSFYKNMATQSERLLLMNRSTTLDEKHKILAKLEWLVVTFLGLHFEASKRPKNLVKKPGTKGYRILSVNSFTSIQKKANDLNLPKIQPFLHKCEAWRAQMKRNRDLAAAKIQNSLAAAKTQDSPNPPDSPNGSQ